MQRRLQRALLGAKFRDIDPFAREFVSVSDQPALETVAARLRMELDGKSIGTVAERLVLADRRLSEPGRPVRQIEGIAMPMKHRLFIEAAQA
jgi:hypothetical protein